MTADDKNATKTLSGLAFAASGVAMTCSYVMLAQMLAAGNMRYGGTFITYLWPAAILGGSFTLARMCGHFYQRGMDKGTSVTACGFLFLESISIVTSFWSALLAIAAGGGAMSTGWQQAIGALIAISLSVIAIVPAIALEMMKDNRGRAESADSVKKQKAALSLVR